MQTKVITQIVSFVTPNNEEVIEVVVELPSDCGSHSPAALRQHKQARWRHKVSHGAQDIIGEGA
jgi:gamma-glutamyl:cysteine ligase YbdK (ATP-grasp superfamily)